MTVEFTCVYIVGQLYSSLLFYLLLAQKTTIIASVRFFGLQTVSFWCKECIRLRWVGPDVANEGQ